MDTINDKKLEALFQNLFKRLFLPRFNKIDKNIAVLQKDSDELKIGKNGILVRLDGIDEKLESVEGRLGKVEYRLEKIDDRLDRQGKTQDSLQKRIDILTTN